MMFSQKWNKRFPTETSANANKRVFGPLDSVITINRDDIFSSRS